MNNVGQLVRDVREQHKLTLKDLSRIIDIDPAYLSRVENGKVRASLGAVKAIADALGIPRSDLMEAAGRLNINSDSKDEIELYKLAVDKGIIDITIRINETASSIADYLIDSKSRRRMMTSRISPGLISFKVGRMQKNAIETIGWNGGPPFPIRRFSEVYCRLEIKEEGLRNAKERARLIPQSRVILINISKCKFEESKRFAIAHEVGHWFLRLYDDFIFDPEPGSELHKSIESEANQFAAELLMPRNLIDEISQDLSFENKIHRLAMAKIFGVSLMAMELRLYSLRLVSGEKLRADSKIKRFERENELYGNKSLSWFVERYPQFNKQSN